jgi:hypothetical protein
MTLEELRSVADLSSGTIGNQLGTNDYEKIDSFVRWLFRPINGGCDLLKGETITFGSNALDGLRNAVSVYTLTHRPKRTRQ